MSKKKLIAVIVAAVIVIAAGLALFFSIRSETTAASVSKEEMQTLISDTFNTMAITDPLKLISEKTTITVNKLHYGTEKDITVDCTITAPDVYSVISPNYDSFLSSDVKKSNGTMFKSALDFKLEFQGKLSELIAEAEITTVDYSITVYETKDKGLVVYTDDAAVDVAFGGIVKITREVSEIKTYKTTENGEEIEKEIQSGNVNKGFNQCLTPRYEAEKPDTSSAIGRMINDLKKDFVKNFIEHDRWVTILKGLATTIELTIFALIIGIVLGFLVAFVRCTCDKLSHPGIIIKLLNGICKIYLTVIRGTPVVVQIMIIYFVIFMPLGINKFLSAVICFGLNSGAYVAEIVRGGIMSVDDGQTEAGRSLGFGYMATMMHIVFPQAFKAVLPALANEFVVLLKETSIAFYIGLGDLMYAGNAIRAATYSAFMPLVTVALIYLVMVLALSKLVSILEKKLRNNER